MSFETKTKTKTKSWRTLAVVYVAGAAAAFALLKPSLASAVWVKQHASGCHVDSGVMHPSTQGEFGLWSDSGVLVAFCPYPETSAAGHATIVGVSLYGYRGDNEFIPGDAFRGKACRSFSTSDSGECGAESSAVSPGNVQMSISDLSKWSSSNGFAYVYSFIDGRDVDLRGVYYQQ